MLDVVVTEGALIVIIITLAKLILQEQVLHCDNNKDSYQRKTMLGRIILKI